MKLPRFRTYILLPFLVALFPVLSLYQRNINEVSVESLVTTVPQVLLATGITFAVLYAVFRKLDVASLGTACAVFYYFTYVVFEMLVGYAYLVLGFFGLYPTLTYRADSWLQLGAYSALFLAVAGSFLQERQNFKNLLRGASLAHTCVVVLTVMNLGLLAVIFHNDFIIRTQGDGGAGYKNLSIESTLPAKRAEAFPDIYYIILDRYARDDVLRRDYDFSNEEFIGLLEDKDFTVLRESRTNYPKTYVSVASSLNGQHLDTLLPARALHKQDQTVVYEVLKNNWVLRLLKSRDYLTYHLGGWWGPTRYNKHADINPSLYAGSSEYTDLLLNTTVSKGIRASLTGTPYAEMFSPYREPSGYDNFVHEIDVMKKLAHNPRKTFAFMHALSIHEPYIFDEACTPGGKSYTTDPTVYLRQLQCTNKHLEDLVETLVAESTDPVIIILQSDEGPITDEMNERKWLSNSHEQLQRHLRIFNAIYSTHPLPVYEGMTPVNTFRIIGREVFGIDVEVVSDVSYINASDDAPLKFTDITDVVVGGDAVARERVVRVVQE